MANGQISAMGWLSGAGSFVQAFGLLESGRIARIHGERARVAAEFAAWQAEEQAGTAIAISQRQAFEEQRRERLDASRALAVAASSGGGVGDPTIVNLLANIRGEGAYRASVALYEGEARARSLRLEALAGRVSGDYAVAEGLATEQAYALGAVGTSFKGAASLFAKYGLNGPSGDAALVRDSSNFRH